MGRRSVLRREDQPGQKDRDAAPPVRTAADDLLALQRCAGNRAVSAMLAREPAAPADAKAPPAAAATAELPGIGTIPLLSVNLDATQFQPPGGRGRGRDREPATAGAIVVTSRLGKHSSALALAATSGRPMTVEIVMGQGKLKLTLENALVSSYSTAGGSEDGIESWTLDATSITHERQGEEPEGGEP